jgi:hypothetical protein
LQGKVHIRDLPGGNPDLTPLVLIDLVLDFEVALQQLDGFKLVPLQDSGSKLEMRRGDVQGSKGKLLTLVESPTFRLKELGVYMKLDLIAEPGKVFNGIAEAQAPSILETQSQSNPVLLGGGEEPIAHHRGVDFLNVLPWDGDSVIALQDDEAVRMDADGHTSNSPKGKNPKKTDKRQACAGAQRR